MSKLTIEDIQRCFYIDETGTVRWKASVEPVTKNHLWRFNGTVAGKLTEVTPSGVQYRRVGYTKCKTKTATFAHVIAFVLHNGEFPEGQVDHNDGDGLNNRGDNLRDVSQRVNLCNAKLSTRNVSGVKGVIPRRRYPGMWQASARVGNKLHNLYEGYDFFLALCARKAFESKHDHLDGAYSTQTYRKVNPQV